MKPKLKSKMLSRRQRARCSRSRPAGERARALLHALPPCWGGTVRRLTRENLKNELAYWKMHRTLMPRHRDKWVIIHDAKVAATADSPCEALTRATPYGADAYIDLVGGEFKILFRFRRAKLGGELSVNSN